MKAVFPLSFSSYSSDVSRTNWMLSDGSSSWDELPKRTVSIDDATQFLIRE